MDPRRSLIPRVLAAPLVLFPVACAQAPQPALIGPQPVTPFERAALPPQPVLHRLVPRRVAWQGCRPSQRTHRRAACTSPPAMLAAAPSALPPAMPRVVSAVYVRPIPVTATPRSPVVYAKPSAPAVVQAADAGPHDHMDGAIRVFVYGPGRVYAVAAAPLRVTTLSLQPGETLVDKAAGDTVRWEIGETTSGAGANVRTLVMLKPLTAGLSTNMVLTTSQRVYLIDLSSAARRADRAIAWSYPQAAQLAAKPVLETFAPESTAPAAVSTHYRITPQGRRPSWTPQLVFDDGRRTFIAFGPELDRRPSPLLFVTDSAGQPALVNYRKDGDLYVVDRLFGRAELRLGGDHPELVQIVRLGGGS